MKKQGEEQQWWTALSNWLETHQSRADYLFVYDQTQGKLDRCFDRKVTLNTVDSATVHMLYQAANEGRLGLLRPDNLEPQLLTTNPKKIFASGKEVPVAAEQSPAAAVQQEAEQPEMTGQQTAPETPAETPVRGVPAEEAPVKAAPVKEAPVNDAPIKDAPAEPGKQAPGHRAERGSHRVSGMSLELERAAANPAVSQQLYAAEEAYRQAIYAPNGAEKVTHEARRAEETAFLARATELIRTAVPLQLEDGFAQEQEMLLTGLAQMVLGSEAKMAEDGMRQENERKAKEELLAAQNLFIWAAASETRDQRIEEARREDEEQRQQDSLAEYLTQMEKNWQQHLQSMAQDLYQMNQSSASEKECNDRIRDFLDGKVEAKKPKETAKKPKETAKKPQEELPVSGEMWGNALRMLCKFAASEVPMSIKHVQVGDHCSRIIRQAAEMGISLSELGLTPQEQTVVRGTIEMGEVVSRGLVAQAALTSEAPIPWSKYRECLCDFLAMKGIEEALVPHVKAHREEIRTGDGPASALQALMAHDGFRADDIQEKVGATRALVRLENMTRQQVANLIKQDCGEVSSMGRQVMVACYQMGAAPQHEQQMAQEPKQPQKGGPML